MAGKPRLLPLGLVAVLLAFLSAPGPVSAQQVVFETTTAYHHIRVLDQAGFRVLSFDGTTESRVSLRDPSSGHFEYTEYFHLPWLWNTGVTSVLMVGLGGASTQRAFERDYPTMLIETVEIDPAVLAVATEYFHFKPSSRQRVHISDGRVYLRRTDKTYDAILMDAYTENRYGSSLPQHLVTKEFFELTHRRLSTNGVLAYNVIGDLRGWRTDLLGAMYKTLKTVYPQVYLFPVGETHNVMVIATKSASRSDLTLLRQRAEMLVRQGRVLLPTFRQRVGAWRAEPPPTVQRAPILTDDFAPVEGLMPSSQ
jgi:spermidine synthase